MPTTTPLTPSRIRIGKRTWERVTVRSRISPSKPGAKSGITTGATRTKRAVIAPSTIVISSSRRRGEAEGLAVVLLPQQLGEDRDEGGLQRGVGEQGADQVGHLEGDREGRHRPADAVVAGGDDFPHQAGDPRGGGGDREEGGGAGDAAGLAAGGGIAAWFLAGFEGLGGAQGHVGVDRPLVVFGVSGALGVSKLGLSRYSRRPPGAGSTLARALDMANIASQKKRILRSERERAENRLLTSTR